MITKETIKKSDLASFLTKSLPLKFLHVSCETPGNFPFRYFSSPNGSLQYQNVKIEYLISFGTAIVIRSTILWNMGIKKLDFPSIAQTALVQKRPLLKKRPFAISKCYKQNNFGCGAKSVRNLYLQYQVFMNQFNKLKHIFLSFCFMVFHLVSFYLRK